MFQHFFSVVVFSVLAIGIQAACHALPLQDSLYFQHVAVFDGQSKIPDTHVLVSDGKITAMGINVVPTSDATIVDGTGKTLMPGLIDCHTHVWFESQLQQAVMFGVTTELDMMSMPEVATNLRRQQANGQADLRADFFSAGAAVTVKDGHGTQFGFPVPTLDDPANTGQFVNDRIREGSDYIKLILEDGSAYGMSKPTLTTEMFKAAVIAAHDRGKLAVAHVSTIDSAQTAIQCEINGLVHLFADQKITPEFIELAKSRKVFVVPTTTVVSNASGSNMTPMLIKDKNLIHLLNNENLSSLSRTFPQRPGLSSSWEILKHNIYELNAAGIPILAGTDAPNPGTDHGVSMHHELRLLVDAGLTNEQALAAATSVPAQQFKLQDRGRIAPGLRADLILVDGDPTADVKLVAKIAGVWKGGVAIDRTERIASVKMEKQNAVKMSVATENRLISDFEGETVVAEFGAGWSESTDAIMGGDSTVEMKIVAGGATDSQSSLLVSGKTREQQPAFAGAMFTPGAVQMQPGNISSHGAISFWAKGTGDSHQIMMFFQKRGFQPSMKSFTADADWKQYRYKISDFDGCDGTDVLGIWFGSGKPGEFQFQIDQLQLEK